MGEVRGYKRKDGTYVRSHVRRNKMPDVRYGVTSYFTDEQIEAVEERLFDRLEMADNGRDLVDDVARLMEGEVTRAQVVEVYNDAISTYTFPSRFQRTR